MTDRLEHISRYKAGSYIIVTAAYNEEHSIERTINSVTNQTRLPLKWYIVSDGSTDKTDEIIKKYSTNHEWIKYYRLEKRASEKKGVEKVSPGKVKAIEYALDKARSLKFDYLAILDADVSFDSNWYETLISEFESDEKLGLCGGMLRSILPDGSQSEGGFKNPDSVGGPVQMFRWKCYTEIGGYKPYGHEDSLASADVQRAGWNTRSLPKLIGDHHVPYKGYASTIRSKLPTCFYMGQMNYVMRQPLWFTFLQTIWRFLFKPYILAGLFLSAGHLWAIIARKKRIPPQVNPLQMNKEFFQLVEKRLKRLKKP